MNALDRRLGDRFGRERGDFANQRAAVPVNGPAAPQPQLAGHQHGDDLIAVGEADQLPVEVPGRQQFRCSDIDNQDVSRLARRDRADAAFEADRIRAQARRMVEPGPTAAGGEIAHGKAKGDALQRLGRIDHAKRVIARAVGADRKADTEFGHHLGRRDRVALPGRCHRIVGDRRIGAGEQHQLGRGQQGRMRDQCLRPERLFG